MAPWLIIKAKRGRGSNLRRLMRQFRTTVDTVRKFPLIPLEHGALFLSK